MVYNRAANNGKLVNGELQDLIDEARKLLTIIELSDLTETKIDADRDYFSGCKTRLKRANSELRLAVQYTRK